MTHINIYYSTKFQRSYLNINLFHKHTTKVAVRYSEVQRTECFGRHNVCSLFHVGEPQLKLFMYRT